MPWNDQSGGGDRGPDKGSGPWGSGPRRPWGAPPRQPPPNQSPDLEEILRRFGERMRGSGGGGFKFGDGKRGFSWPLIAGALFGGWLLLGVYMVDEGENAVITTFGNYSRTTGPGLHWHAPPPIEARRVVNVTGQRTREIGFTEQNNRIVDNPEESLMITGDRNIVEIHFRIYYNIADVRGFVFNVRDPEQAVRGVAESAMREVIGRRQLEPIITTDRAAVELEVEELLQQVLDEYEVGVRVLQVELLSAAAPPAVIEAFNDVVNAGQDAEAARNNAQREAARITNEAQAYRERVVREATGEAERFNAVYDEYRASPRVTRDRLYLETMERVFNNADTIILDQRGGAVPYLPLDGMIRRNAAPRAQAGGG
ncbi:MAG: FtsH protease activity modulator HflK [Hyphomonadaceae bacterium]|nr:FtsH protease activity modulator HflK [Hyphomonadaceae bacterium]